MAVMVDVVMVRVALAVPLDGTVALEGFTTAGSLAAGKNRDNATVPVKPLTLIMLTADWAEAPCARVWDEGFTVRMKVVPALVAVLFVNELTIVPPATVPRAAVRTMRKDFRCMRLLDSNLYHYPQDKPYRPTGRTVPLRVV